jgi:hypothetical protein
MAIKILWLWLIATAAVAAGPDFFPLQPGNIWIYRGTGIGASIVTVEVTRRAAFAGKTFSLVEGWPGGAVWLRNGEDGIVRRFDPE